MTDDDTTQTPPGAEPTGEPKPEANVEPDLGDGGRRALDTERTARKTAEREAREARDRLAELEAGELRRKVASAKNLTPQQSAFLDGSTEEEMGARADELIAAFAPAADGDDVRHRPRERLRSGAAPSAEPRDIGKVADDVLRG